ncbi:cation-translocating P-type ATPase [Limobrevibacterium gyesilva]|uniref:Cation-translocating P-type ATPase n=1 Tax=Limobrevibacterium gyesilva TaxID=2991712 RepID=A0AA41YL03_9PROT|nr:cation-translocating P-type ATPase [Limobrevibacterium gyesilva]MCW3473833.1 cation-translocating P-type ATPase [Limobrevibacterium gyesilva]
MAVEETPSVAPTWHTLDADAVAARLGSDPARGLPAREVGARQARYGPNAIREKARRSKLRMLLAQVTDFMILLLIAAAVISGMLGNLEDTLVILGIVVLNAAVSFAQELRAERAMEALKRMAAATATVVRDGQPQAVPAEALVPGDVVLLEAGNAVPADLRLVEAVDLKLGEAALTGESLPAEKLAGPLADPGLPLGDRHNMAFKGTAVMYGRGRGVAVATGMQTELGRIAGMLESVGETRTPLQRRLTVFGQQLAIGALAICALVFVIGLLRGEPALLMLLTAVSLAVAAIPEAMPAVVTVLLALGAGRMARGNALIRRLPAVETLGSVTYICSDKTGTLTRNEMRVVEAFIGGGHIASVALDPARPPADALLRAMALCNDVVRAPDGRPLGDPTEVALWQAAADAGIDKAALERNAARVMEQPFDSERKRMTTVHLDGGGFIAYTKGAPEIVLALCTGMAIGDGVVPLDPEQATRAAERMAEDGLRVLAVACRRWDMLPGNDPPGALEHDLTLLGLVGLVDPPREEVKTAVATCRAAGIVPVMITGDHLATARAIARQLGILTEGGMVLTGRELRMLPEAELRRRVAQIRVYARVDPAQKIRIVAALQEQGEIVAMTGDGVNDAPALARADIGIAMGQAGTDVARESASLVLLDDNFATIVTAVREGRRIYDNIRKFVRYVVTCNTAEIWTVFLAPFLGLPLPLLPIQILWINLVTDGLPGLALAAESAERGVMQRPPRPPQEGLLARGMVRHMLWFGLLMAGVTLLTQAYAIGAGLEHWQTMTFTVLTLSQMGQVMAVRSDRDSLFQQGLRSNLPLLGAVVLTIVLQLAVIYIPPLNPLFGTSPLTAVELLMTFVLSSVVFAAIEIDKYVVRSRAHARQMPAVDSPSGKA